MKQYERIFVVVLDSLGIGAMPDSPRFGDNGVDTFGHILERMGTLETSIRRGKWRASPIPWADTCGWEKPAMERIR